MEITRFDIFDTESAKAFLMRMVLLSLRMHLQNLA